jgi:hypothetical protein
VREEKRRKERRRKERRGEERRGEENNLNNTNWLDDSRIQCRSHNFFIRRGFSHSKGTVSRSTTK